MKPYFTILSVLYLFFCITCNGFAQAPGLKWAKNFGGKGSSNPTTLVRQTTDLQGNIYNVGHFLGKGDFNSSSTDSLILQSSGSADAFIQKLNPNGQLIWARRIGGIYEDRSLDVAVDQTGHVFLAGKFQGAVDFDPGPGVVKDSAGTNGRGLFLVKLNPAGQYVKHKRYPGIYEFEAAEIEINAHNQLYMAYNASADRLHLAKVDKDTLGLVWDKAFGNVTSGWTRIEQLNIDKSGNLLCTGQFSRTVFLNPDDPAATISSNATTFDVFIAKYDSTGTYAFGFGIGSSSQYDNGISIASDGPGNIYVAGKFSGTADFNPGASVSNLTSLSGSNDIFILKLSPTGAFNWAKKIGSANDDDVSKLALGPDNNPILVCSIGGSTDMDPGSGTYTLNPATTSSAIVKLTSAGNFSWAYLLGFGSPLNNPFDLYVSGNKNVVIAGSCNSVVYAIPGSNNSYFTQPGNSFNLVWNQCDAISSIQNVTGCNNYTASNGQVFTSSGTYVIHIQNSNGCDSAVTLNITLKKSSSIINPIVCNQYTSPSGQVYTVSGNYISVIPNMAGCDSTITINLTIKHGSTATLNPTTCNSYTSPSGQVYSASGTYTSVIQNMAGCDSTITINLSVVPLSPTISQNNNAMSCSVSGGSSYEWLDCNNGMTPVQGENEDSFSPTVSGSFAVSVIKNGCSAVSPCFPFVFTGNVALPVVPILVLYPNPAGNQLLIKGLQAGEHAITIYSSDGKQVAKRIVSSIQFQSTQLNISELNPGMYELNEGASHLRFVKE